MDKTTLYWIKLPKDLRVSITKRLTRNEILVLRATCNRLRYLVPFPQRPVSPDSTLNIPSPVSSAVCDSSLLSLTQSTLYIIRPIYDTPAAASSSSSTCMWLVNVEELNSGRVRVKDPLTGALFRNLPSNSLPNSLNLLDYRVTEIAQSYGLGLASDHDDCKGRNAYFVQKVAVSPCFEDDSFTIMAIYSMKKLGIWRKNDPNWTQIPIGDGRVYVEDIAFHKGKFYALNQTGLTIAVEPKSFEVNEIVAPNPKFNGTGIKHLVKSFQDLFLVFKQIYCHDNVEINFEDEEESERYLYPVRVDVFKLDEEINQWVHVVNGLKDTSFFVDNACSYSISTKEFPAFRENCVYLIDTLFIKDYDNKYPGWCTGVYDLKDGTVAPLSNFPIYSKNFWPPPSWLNTNVSVI